MRLRLITAAFILAHNAASSQEDAKKIFEGNQYYHSGKLPEAASKYARAAEANPSNRKANFNLGNALYKNGMMLKEGKLQVPQGQNVSPDSLAGLAFDRAAQNFAIVANSVSDPDTLHRAWHNIGNCYLQRKEYREAVNAYKKSLRFDPKDEETRYNLAWALKHLPKEEQKGGGAQQKQQQQQQEKKQQQQSQMNKDQAEQLLKALMDEERKLQERRKQKQEDPSNTTVDKDW